jgi:drug/metabolite transporter (DMT)-like permease
MAWGSLIVVYLVWGSTYLAIRVAVRDLPPALMAGARYVIAGALLYPIAIRTGSAEQRIADGPTRRHWLACSVVGTLLLACGNGGVTLAERTLPSGLAAVLVATVPLWMVGYGAVLERHGVGARAALGVLIGLSGVVVLASGGPLAGDTRGTITILVAASAWGLGSVLGHRLALPGRILLAAAMEMLAGGVVLLVVAAGTGEFGQLHLAKVGATSWLGFVWLIVPGSILAFSAYGYALTHLPLPTVSTYAYVNPVVAVALATLLLGEAFSLREAAGTALVVAAVALTLRRDARVPDTAVADAAAQT